MRKHFLILMLLALLPLSGWAANVVVTIGNINKAYKDPNPPVTASMFAVTNNVNVNEATLKDHLTITRIQTGEEVGETYTFTLTYDGHLDGVENVICSNEGRMTIVKKNLSTLDADNDIEITGSTAIQQASGKAEPTVKVTVNGEVLTLNEDYTVEYGANATPGQDGTITIAAANNSTKFQGQIVKEFTVKTDISAVEFNYVNGTSVDDDLVYSGIAKTISEGNIVATLNNAIFANFELVNDGYSNNINQGTATATVKGTGDYDGTATVSFEITKRAITLNAKNGKRAYGEPNTNIVEATQNAGLANVAVGTLANSQHVVPVITTAVAQTAVPAENAGVITLDATNTKIFDANNIDVTSNYNITWNAANAQLTIVPQTLNSEAIELTFTPSKEYDGTAAIPTYTLVDKNLNKALVEKDNTNNNDFTVTLSNNANTTNAGSYTIQFTGNGNYTGNAYNEAQTVTISAKPINIKVNDLTIGMGTLPQFTLDQSYLENVIGQDNLGVANVQYVIKDNNEQPVAPANLTPGTYSVTATNLSNNNYDYNYLPGTLTVTNGDVLAIITVNNGQALTFGDKIANNGITIKHFEGLAEGQAVTNFNNGVVTNGVEYKIYDKATGLEAQTVKKTVVNNNVAQEVDLGFYPAGTYIVKKAAGNPTYQQYNITVLDGEFTINPFDLTTNTGDKVAVADLTRQYTGTAIIPDTEGKITFKYGDNADDKLTLVAGTDYSVALLPSETTGNVTTTYDNTNVAGTHKVTISAVADGNFTGSQKKTFAITKAPLTITADAKTWYYGTNATEFTATVGVENANLIGQDAQLNLATLTPAQATAAGFAGTLKVRNTQTTTQGLHEGALQAYFEKADQSIVELNDADAADNYTITRVNGNYTIGKSQIWLKVKDVTKVYGTAFAPDGFVLDEEKTDLETYPLTAVYKNNITSFLNDINIQVAAFNEADGKYRVGKNYAITGTATATNFVIKGIADGTFTLTPYAITVKTEDQDIDLSQQESFDNVASTEGGDATVSITEGQLQNGDLIGAIVASLNATQNVGENPISIVSANNPDYTLTPVNTGVLTITGANNITLNDPATVAATITTYAADPNQVNVTINFDNRNDVNNKIRNYGSWAAEQWNTLVLPFDITVAELSEHLGYAIVNVIDPNGATYDANGKPVFKFRLTMKGGNDDENGNLVLKANRPFTVKTAEPVSGDIDFGYHKIVAPTANDIMDAGLGCKFVGTYESVVVDKNSEGKIRFLTGDYTNWIAVGASSNNAFTVVPFAAYIDMSTLTPQQAAEAIFIMEELDGTATAIRGINADEIGSAKNVEGMYNLNGMKLNSVPTQKGIYIQNGKKVVIK